MNKYKKCEKCIYFFKDIDYELQIAIKQCSNKYGQFEKNCMFFQKIKKQHNYKKMIIYILAAIMFIVLAWNINLLLKF